MKRSALILLIAGLLQAMPAAAQPCVGAAYDKPLPGAVDVIVQQVDVPSSQFPGVWQEGHVNGSFYQIFSNRVAVLRADRRSQEWSVTLECQQRPCRTTTTGAPPDAIKATLIQLEQCIVPPEVKVATDPAKPKPQKAKPKAQVPQESAKAASDKAKPKAEPKPAQTAADKPVPDKAKAKPEEPPQSAKTPPQDAKPKGEVKPGGTVRPKPRPEAAKPKAKVELGATASSKGAGAETPAVGSGTDASITTTGTKTSPEPQGKPAKGGTGAQVAAAKNQPSAQNAAPGNEVVCVPAPNPKPLTCGLSLLPPGTPEMTLQRLLVLAGADPGPIDGAIGKKTKDSLLLVVGFAGRDMNLQQSIAAVDAYLCRQGQPLP